MAFSPLLVPALGDEVVILRRWRDSDLHAITAGLSDPMFQQFSWSSKDPYTEADARRFLAENTRRPAAEAREVAFAVVDPLDPDVVLGGCSLHGIDPDQGRLAVGYWVDPQARGRGVATHAVLLLAGWVFNDLGFARLELTCDPDNAASQAVARRCGFIREGFLRSHMSFQGGRRDSVLWSLLPSDLP